MLDGWWRTVALEADLISRIRSASGKWEFYDKEDITNGKLVFTGVQSVSFDPSGPLPNDFIDRLEVKPFCGQEGDPATRVLYLFEASVSSVDRVGDSREVLIRIVASGIHIEDPLRPETRLCE